MLGVELNYKLNIEFVILFVDHRTKFPVLKAMLSITPVILSGGSGTRLWPSSRSKHPKQFLRLTSEISLIQQTLLRLDALALAGPPLVIANHDHRFLVAEHLAAIDINPSKIILEPCARNTAPAIALAALSALDSQDSVLLVLPADHLIKDVSAFHAAIELGLPYCEQGKLVTFGIVPTNAATGFGYIKSGNEVGAGGYELSQFIEKPNANKAQALLDEGGYSWNSGMFMFRASDYIAELTRYRPEIVDLCRSALDASENDLGFLKVSANDFSKCPSDSIDYALMEKTNNGVVIPIDVGWSDIGSWSAIHGVQDQDESGNVIQGVVVESDVKNSLLISDKKLVAAIGVENTVLVETDDAILLASMDRVHDVGELVSQLQDQSAPQTELHRKVYRPWGSYDSLESGDGFQVKRLIVKPGEKLSLQMHKHRAEHWIVVKGLAEVVNGDDTFLLNVNESTYIPLGAKHSLANPGKDDLEIIEVQSGSYLGEDDIIRFEDVYGRHKE